MARLHVCTEYISTQPQSHFELGLFLWFHVSVGLQWIMGYKHWSAAFVPEKQVKSFSFSDAERPPAIPPPHTHTRPSPPLPLPPALQNTDGFTSSGSMMDVEGQWYFLKGQL